MQYFVRFLSPGSAETVRWETKQSFDGQLYQEYSYQNLLKLDHFFLQVMMKKFWCVFYALQCFINST